MQYVFEHIEAPYMRLLKYMNSLLSNVLRYNIFMDLLWMMPWIVIDEYCMVFSPSRQFFEKL